MRMRLGGDTPIHGRTNAAGRRRQRQGTWVPACGGGAPARWRQWCPGLPVRRRRRAIVWHRQRRLRLQRRLGAPRIRCRLWRWQRGRRVVGRRPGCLPAHPAWAARRRRRFGREDRPAAVARPRRRPRRRWWGWGWIGRPRVAATGAGGDAGGGIGGNAPRPERGRDDGHRCAAGARQRKCGGNVKEGQVLRDQQDEEE